MPDWLIVDCGSLWCRPIAYWDRAHWSTAGLPVYCTFLLYCRVCPHCRGSAFQPQSPACGPRLVFPPSLSSVLNTRSIITSRWKDWATLEWRTNKAPETPLNAGAMEHMAVSIWCPHLDPVRGPVSRELAFLQGQLDSANSWSRIKVAPITVRHRTPWMTSYCGLPQRTKTSLSIKFSWKPVWRLCGISHLSSRQNEMDFSKDRFFC